MSLLNSKRELIVIDNNLKKIVFLDTSWGVKHGGINAFNMDLCIACAKVLKDEYNVICVVTHAKPEEIASATKDGVTIISLFDAYKAEDKLDSSWADKIWRQLKSKNLTVEWWVGHDIKSGEVANLMPQISGQGSSAVIKHMSYIDYVTLKTGNASKAQKKSEEQKNIFSKANKCFAVGPLLTDRLHDMLGGENDITTLIPGLPYITPQKAPRTFTAVTFGRLDPENDRIKQGTTAIAAFAEACKLADNSSGRPEALRKNPRMKLFGISAAGGEEEESLRNLANERAGKAINVMPLPYEEDRDKLFEELAKSSVALMLSWHEGFGLVGWEAISAGVPLILSEHSGLFELIRKKLGGAGIGCVSTINVRVDKDGIRSDDGTISKVADKILEIASDIDYYRENAKQLRSFLEQEGYTWEATATSLAKGLGLTVAKEVTRSTEGIDAQLLLTLMRDAICYNQGEHIQYSYLASELHKVLKTSLLNNAKQSKLGKDRSNLENFLNRNLIQISKKNFDFIERYFQGRHATSPRICIKVNVIHNEGVEQIEPILRDTQVKYVSDYLLSTNTGFIYVKSNGKYFLCNNIPASIATGEYVNARIDKAAAIKYFNNVNKKRTVNGNATEIVYDSDWSECWLSCSETGKKVEDPKSCYKSTLIIPLTLWNNRLEPLFFEKIGAKTKDGRSIFGYLCLDHISENYFNSSDVDMGYIFADILSLYWMTRSIYTDYSETYKKTIT